MRMPVLRALFAAASAFFLIREARCGVRPRV